ncbi:MAG: YgiQ family radical SAM protein [Marinilabiliales bacterium]|nr:MAG: YgiQ family radical SAM protein [Marinilabiliales bacterium]
MVEKYSNNISSIFPTNIKELKNSNWDYVDVILISGDAFIDHTSFGTAVIARVLHDAGYRVAVLPQPNWQDDLRDFKKFGKPRLFFGVSAGNMDSMLNHYTAGKRKRSEDAYSPGGEPGKRPDYATIEYSRILKGLYPDVPLVIGGVEASMRRFVHYDYWSNKLMPSVLESSGADLLVYGMAEKSILEIANRLNDAGQIYNCYDIRQIAYLSDFDDEISNDIVLSSYSEVLSHKNKHGENFVKIEKESNLGSNCRIIQDQKKKRLIVNPAYDVLTEAEIDRIYSLPFTRLPHPRYIGKKPIPAYEMIKDSVTMHRGCFGGCSFCTISAHQGKLVSSRSEKSILSELDYISKMPEFKGHITDLGGPSANMYQMKGINQDICDKCVRPSCIFPSVCKNLDTSHKPLIDIYEKASRIRGIKNISIGSGVRYDLAMHQTNSPEVNRINHRYLELLISKYVSGRLKVAPEHSSSKVLKTMRKNSFNTFRNFEKLFRQVNKKFGLNQQLIPYFISGHPSSTETDMAELALETKDMGFKLEQVQAFTPTPMTLATVMYYTGINPYTGKKIFVARDKTEKENQLQYFFWYKSDIRKKILNNLKKSGRKDLIDRFYGKKSAKKR